jgi:hypothetical protein
MRMSCGGEAVPDTQHNKSYTAKPNRQQDNAHINATTTGYGGANRDAGVCRVGVRAANGYPATQHRYGTGYPENK